ncbi:hypothetical protein [Devosia psychrophila]|uniref:Uncharacterized protein n=1 Tax=Devosia psychrophila TaxID=728005 RepID=A0A0F5Q445_9HYPH|nr:hypothetical protein [Devosia psychrophila]KKC34844.1 hypothetical protein WH91_01050 [Devosia psychrophila]SFC10326.1 hypothetical protein SAMN04488059_102141 [Devosia psychrophila]
MDSISRYHLSAHEAGLWNVIDTTTGGPAEVEVDGKFMLLYKLPREEAEGWSRTLNAGLGAHRPSRAKP